MEVSVAKKTQSNCIVFKNILRQDNIRIFALRDKYFLVNSNDFAFLVFEKIPTEQLETISTDDPTIKLIDFDFSYDINKFPGIKRAYFNELSGIDIEYICNAYLDFILGENDSKSFNKRLVRLKERNRISLQFAKILAKLPRGVNIYELCSDVREAHFYLIHKEDWQILLKKGTRKEKKRILSKLFPPKTYDILQIDTTNHDNLNILINEIFNIGY